MKTKAPRFFHIRFLLCICLALLPAQVKASFYYAAASAGGGSSSLLTSLSGYWEMDEASGNRSDASGNGLTLTDTNTVTSQTGKVGTNCAEFTLANAERLTRADTAALSIGASSFTVAFWCYTTSQAADMMIVTKDSGGDGGVGHREFQIYYAVASDNIRCSLYNSSDSGLSGSGLTATTFGAVPNATWFYVVWWVDAGASTVNFQINNGTVDSSTFTGSVNDSDHTFEVGCYSIGEQCFNGRIDGLGVWKRVLTTGERTSLYNSGSGVTYATFP